MVWINESMVKIAKRNAQMDNLIAIVGETSLNLSPQVDSQPFWWKDVVPRNLKVTYLLCNYYDLFFVFFVSPIRPSTLLNRPRAVSFYLLYDCQFHRLNKKKATYASSMISPQWMRCGEAESCLVIPRYHIRQSTTA